MSIREQPHPSGAVGVPAVSPGRRASGCGCFACFSPAASSSRADYQSSACGAPMSAFAAGLRRWPTPPMTGPSWARAARVAGLRARVHQEVFGLDDTVIPAAMERLQDSAPGPGRRRGGGGRPLARGGRCVPPRPVHGVVPALPGGGALHAPRRSPSGHSRGRIPRRGRAPGTGHGGYWGGVPGRRSVERCLGAAQRPARGLRGRRRCVRAGHSCHPRRPNRPGRLRLSRLERCRGCSLSSLQRPSGLRYGSGRGTPRGRGGRRSGHRQSRVERFARHVRGDARCVEAAAEVADAGAPAATPRPPGRLTPDAGLSPRHTRGSRAWAGATSPAVSSLGRAPTSSPSGCPRSDAHSHAGPRSSSRSSPVLPPPMSAHHAAGVVVFATRPDRERRPRRWRLLIVGPGRDWDWMMKRSKRGKESVLAGD